MMYSFTVVPETSYATIHSLVLSVTSKLIPWMPRVEVAMALDQDILLLIKQLV